jgi:hypothetical protein
MTGRPPHLLPGEPNERAIAAMMGQCPYRFTFGPAASPEEAQRLEAEHKGPAPMPTRVCLILGAPSKRVLVGDKLAAIYEDLRRGEVVMVACTYGETLSRAVTIISGMAAPPAGRA